MGEKYIQVSSNKGETLIAPGTRIAGKPFMDLDVLIEQADAVSSDLSVLIANVNTLTGELKKLTVNLNDTVEGNQDKISRIIDNLELTSENVQELTADIKGNPWKLLYRPRERRKQ